jgi:hypothetical protein
MQRIRMIAIAITGAALAFPSTLRAAHVLIAPVEELADASAPCAIARAIAGGTIDNHCAPRKRVASDCASSDSIHPSDRVSKQCWQNAITGKMITLCAGLLQRTSMRSMEHSRLGHVISVIAAPAGIVIGSSGVM